MNTIQSKNSLFYSFSNHFEGKSDENSIKTHRFHKPILIISGSNHFYIALLPSLNGTPCGHIYERALLFQWLISIETRYYFHNNQIFHNFASLLSSIRNLPDFIASSHTNPLRNRAILLELFR